jgi:hypothetical protein
MENQTQFTIIDPNQALEATIRAEIDIAVSTAKRYPRDIQQCRASALAMATLSPEIAESCFYVLPRDGKKVEGPSVRLAEIIVSSFKNIKIASRIVGNDGKTITAEAMCMDTENNVAVSIQVKRRITKKDGTTFNEDMQVVTGNAASAIAYRNAALKVIPMAFTHDIYEAVKRLAMGSPADLATNRAKALQYIQDNFKVPAEIVCKTLQKASIDFITLDDIATLKGFINAIKENDSTVDQIFYPEKKTDKPEPEPIDPAELEAISNKLTECTTIDELGKYYLGLDLRLQTDKKILSVKNKVKKQLEINFATRPIKD